MEAIGFWRQMRFDVSAPSGNVTNPSQFPKSQCRRGAARPPRDNERRPGPRSRSHLTAAHKAGRANPSLRRASMLPTRKGLIRKSAVKRAFVRDKNCGRSSGWKLISILGNRRSIQLSYGCCAKKLT